jgi:Ni,Fe-hydrogenase III small subunit
MSVAPPNTLSGFTTSSATVCTGQNNVLYTVPFQNDVFYNWNYSTPGASINGAGNSITIDFLNFASNGVLSVYGVNSCSVSPTLTMAVTVLPSPTISVSGNTSVCDNAQETLMASGAASYTWSTGENTASIVVSPTVATVYTVTGLAANGCASSLQHSITVLPSPTVQVSGSTASVCPNETVAVNAAGDGDLFIWSDGYFGANHTIKALATTVFTVTNTFTANSCYSQATYTLNVKPGPVMAISGNTLVCEATTVSLTATGADSYAWSDGVTTNTNTFLPASTTTLTVVGQLANGCKDSIVQTIKVLSTPTVSIAGGDTICQGQFVTLTATANGTVSYGWNSGANTQSISVSPAGTFTYEVTAYNGACSGTATHEVVVKLIPAIDFEIGNPALCPDSPPFTFTANPSGGAYSGTGVTADTFDPSVGAGVYGITYEVTVSNGCLATQTETIEVMTCTGINTKSVTGELKLFPNPATDDITVLAAKEIASISIYDFTGKLVKIIETNGFQETIGIGELARGLYTVAILMQDHTQAALKIVKQ